MRLLALNVRTLGPKLEFLLSLPFDVFCFSEVRASWTGKKTMSRVASALGFSAVWSVSPPPSPTFAVSPGGTAIFAKQPLTLEQDLVRPPTLEKWFQEARVCIARVVDAGRMSLCVASCYGYPCSHPSRGTNEAYLRDIVSYMGGLMCPSMCGDLNDHPSTSEALARMSILHMHRITDDAPTTLGKRGDLSQKLPLDHVLVNDACLELGVRAKCDPTLLVSDHVPVLMDVPMVIWDATRVVWAKPLKDLYPKVVNPPWPLAWP